MRTALAEHDQLGLVEFCEKYGFGRTRNYVIADGTSRYGTRVIAAAAHGQLPGQAPLKPLEVADDDLVSETLKALQFKVNKLSPPDWSRDELILACSQLFSNGRVAQRAKDPAVQQLAAFLRQLPFHAPQDRGLNFRSVNSVQRKLFDLKTALPDYTGKKTRGGALDEVIVSEFLTDEAEMHSRAAEIRAIHEPRAWALFSTDIGLGSSYTYNSEAGSPQQLREGHVIVLHDDEDVLGIARIVRIKQDSDLAAVTQYVAHYGGTWRPLDGAISTEDLNEARIDAAIRNVIGPLDVGKLEAMLARVAVPLSSRETEARAVAKIKAMRRSITGEKPTGSGQGEKAPKGGRRESKTMARKGQGGFREKLIRRYGHVCAITGSCPAEVLQAAHLRGFADHETHNLTEGVLLRADVHLLFDKHLLTVDPTTWRVVLAPSLSGYDAYAPLQGVRFAEGPCKKAITDHFLAVTAKWV